MKAQEIYDNLYMETIRRCAAKGTTPPSEIEIFKSLVAYTREQVLEGHAHPDLLEDLQNVTPQRVLKLQEEKAALEKDKAIREGRGFGDIDWRDVIMRH